MPTFSFQQVDVFTDKPLKGNPLAVVIGADGLGDEAMESLANWTNLSETTFLLKPTDAAADYRVRIFTPERELPFAGHPTLGSCQVWLNSGGRAKQSHIVQECGAGLVRIRRDGKRLAFAAPPLRRSGDVDGDTLEELQAAPDQAGRHQGVAMGRQRPRLGRRDAGVARPGLGTKAGLSGAGRDQLGVVAPWTAADGREAQISRCARFIPSRATGIP